MGSRIFTSCWRALPDPSRTVRAQHGPLHPRSSFPPLNNAPPRAVGAAQTPRGSALRTSGGTAQHSAAPRGGAVPQPPLRPRSAPAELSRVLGSVVLGDGGGSGSALPPPPAPRRARAVFLTQEKWQILSTSLIWRQKGGFFFFF